MKDYRPLKERVRSLCADPGEEDGVALHSKPARRHRKRRAPRDEMQDRQVDRKVSQLCRQVAVTLDGVFADCGDGVLRNLHVASVAPFPDASRLVVSVSSVDGRLADGGSPEVVLDHLNHASGHLRREIAAAVTRKRAPLLIYRLAEPAPARSDA